MTIVPVLAVMEGRYEIVVATEQRYFLTATLGNRQEN